jgi:hypothetical protein
VTTYRETVQHFAKRSRRAAEYLERWRAQTDKATAVVPYVEQATTAAAYRLRPSDVEAACACTVHALGDIKKKDALSVRSIVDWHPSFAFQHVLHYCLEASGAAPTYQAFRDFCRTDPQARSMLADPSIRAVERAMASGFTRQLAQAAMQWRVGNAYLSFMRELYVLAVLRDAGVDARYHVLADVLFRVDFWVSDLCLSVFVGNPMFLAGSSGRKIPAPDLLADAPFQFAHLELPTRHEYGRVHLPDPDEILSALAAVRS